MTTNNLIKIVEEYLINNSNKLIINSKNIVNGDVFVALQGNKNHGNTYADQAIKNGAKYIITDKSLKSLDKKKIYCL